MNHAFRALERAIEWDRYLTLACRVVLVVGLMVFGRALLIWAWAGFPVVAVLP